MESLASPDTIYLTQATADLCDGYFDLQDLGEFNVKGNTGAVHVHQLTGVGPLRTRFEVSRARGLSHFVGRADEMEILEKALDRARKGHGQVVGVVAHAGVGKSRLCFEFLERHRARGVFVNQGQAVPHGRNIPLLPLMQAFPIAAQTVDARNHPIPPENIRGANSKVQKKAPTQSSAFLPKRSASMPDGISSENVSAA
jgi:hypothetical protein